MSLFRGVKQTLQKDVFKTDRLWWTKNIWQKPERWLPAVESAVLKIKQEVTGFEFSPETTSRKIWDLRREIDISPKRNRSLHEGKYLEEVLERALVAAYPPLKNQFNLLSGSGSV